ncbi:MAG TPA: hypothetical protein DDW84_05425 [Phycisphaerales bacterium]|nr:MAG: hypothetical protein A2Y13_10870 [Planctomycetes bacterium GWC2_45_44]HBG78274.1 hypothetical protein [Phycisphaerales bacterium]HBR18826.1 hypothetical protein [Phycisphaerales bacterium]
MLKKTFSLIFSLPKIIFGLMFCTALLFIGIGVYKGGSALDRLFTENAKLKKAISNLTDAGKIGYAKVISQKLDAKGKIISTELKFIETSRDNELDKVLEKIYTVDGDIVHFDALIVKFGDKVVMDGQKKSLYLWRRIYGDNTAPSAGFLIEEPNKEPQRYRELLTELPLKQRELFWTNIWDLANDPQKLQRYDIDAIFGNVTYVKLKKGLLYIFRITPTGQVYPEVIPDF